MISLGVHDRGREMATYRFEIDDEEWATWKETVPPSKDPETRLRELIRADTEGRVEPSVEDADGDAGETASSVHGPAGTIERYREQLRDRLPGEGDVLERRVDAILQMYGLLAVRGAARRDQLLRVVDVGTTGYGSGAELWSETVADQETLAALPNVERQSDGDDGSANWVYTGDGPLTGD